MEKPSSLPEKMDKKATSQLRPPPQPTRQPPSPVKSWFRAGGMSHKMSVEPESLQKGERQIIYFYDKVSEMVKASDIYLNNFYNSPFMADDFEYPTLEHYYQASKFNVEVAGSKFIFEEIRQQIAPKDAHSLGRFYERDPKARFGDEKFWGNWKERKVEVMRKGIEYKFSQNPHLQSKLVMTEDSILVQSSGKDAFWGGTLPGSENTLGRLLMEYREKCRAGGNMRIMPVDMDEGNIYEDQLFANTENVNGKKEWINQNFMEDSKDMQAKSQFKREKAEGGGTLGSTTSLLSMTRSVSQGEQDKKQKDEIELLLVKISPFMYLGTKEKNILLREGTVESYPPESCILLPKSKDDNFSCYILLSGEVLVHTRSKQKFLERLTRGSFFGQDGPLFNTRLNVIIAYSGCTVLRISYETFFKILQPNSLFALGISHNLIHKNHVFRNLIDLKDYISHLWGKEKVDLRRLLYLYRKIDSALHPKMKSSEIDISSWMYAIRRLPQNITECFTFFISTKCPELLSHPDLMMPIKSHARPRAIFQVMQGKSIIMLRDLVTDLQDFLCNLCIHIIESRKLQEKLLSPQIIRDLLVSENEEQTIQFLRNFQSGGLSEGEISGLAEIWPVNLASHLANMMLHHNDYKINLKKPVSHLKQDPVEQWSSQLWKNVCNVFDIDENTLCGELNDEDFVVDIFQGSRRSFLNMISPHQYINRDKIFKWGEEVKPKVKTGKFLCEEDRLNALNFHFLLSETQENSVRIELEKKYGIHRIEETYLTGIMVVLVNVNKMDRKYTDPAFNLTPKGKYHLIVNIGYTFGTQSTDIARALLSLFGNKIRSFNIVGKAGGLTGKRGDILICDKLYTDDSDDAVNNELGPDFDGDVLEKQSQTGVHVGPMLTVAGTILQNSILLNFYKKLWNCVGLEMEGYYYGNEIAKYKNSGYVKPQMISRFAYYVSDLPLDPESNLSQEEGLISWDEGVPSISAIYRYFLKLLFPFETKK